LLYRQFNPAKLGVQFQGNFEGEVVFSGSQFVGCEAPLRTHTLFLTPAVSPDSISITEQVLGQVRLHPATPCNSNEIAAFGERTPKSAILAANSNTAVTVSSISSTWTRSPSCGISSNPRL
jgi:hypothetical protein